MVHGALCLRHQRSASGADTTHATMLNVARTDVSGMTPRLPALESKSEAPAITIAVSGASLTPCYGGRCLLHLAWALAARRGKDKESVCKGDGHRSRRQNGHVARDA